MNETVLDSPFCLENEAGVLRDNNAINSFIVICVCQEARTVFQAGFISPLFSTKGNLPLGAVVIQQLSAPFSLSWLPVKGLPCSQFLLPWDLGRLPLPAQGAEPAQRAARAGVNAGREKWDFSPWQQAVRSMQAINNINYPF